MFMKENANNLFNLFNLLSHISISYSTIMSVISGYHTSES